MSLDFANILFGGPCNRRCPFCIGQQLPASARQNNLDRYPLLNQQLFADQVNRLGIRQIVLTGTVTDPSLYRHQSRLLEWLRGHLNPSAVYSLHTNGVKAAREPEQLGIYDKVCISFPSFNADTYRQMMGSTSVPDLGAILRRSPVPVKVSCVITRDNYPELPDFLRRCQQLGLRRLVLRKLFGETATWSVLPELSPVRFYRGNPVYDLEGMEVTYWDFDQSESTSINLFPDGTLGNSYLLAQTPEFAGSVSGRPIHGGGRRGAPEEPEGKVSGCGL